MIEFSIEFDLFLERFKNKENFAFSRFSDGELFILQNKKVVLAENHYITGDVTGAGRYPVEEQKQFIPEWHQEFRKRLMESFVGKVPNYFKGVSGKVDVGEDDFQWQMQYLKEDLDHVTFANVFINKNYPRFIQEIVPLLKDRNVAIVANEAAVWDKFLIRIQHHFKIGNNCIHNNLDTIEEVREFTKDKENWVILCSASSLSNLIVYENFKENSNNSYVDIGSSLSPWMGDKITGWMYSRAYLQHWILNRPNQYGEKEDVW